MKKYLVFAAIFCLFAVNTSKLFAQVNMFGVKVGYLSLVKRGDLDVDGNAVFGVEIILNEKSNSFSTIDFYYSNLDAKYNGTLFAEGDMDFYGVTYKLYEKRASGLFYGVGAGLSYANYSINGEGIKVEADDDLSFDLLIGGGYSPIPGFKIETNYVLDEMYATSYLSYNARF